MTLGALNVLDMDPDGLYLLVEGGGVDRAMHANNLGRMIEDQIEFDAAVAAVSAYLDANTNGNNWANTLVIVTADHDHLLFGPDSDTVFQQDLTDNGKGNLPGHKWQFSSHSNQLVPLFARGPGSELLALYADQRDFGRLPPNAAGGPDRVVDRLYLDQTEIYAALVQTQAVPEPASVALAGVAGLGLAVRRLRRRA